MVKALPVFLVLLAACFLTGCTGTREEFIPVEISDIALDSERRLQYRAEEETGILDSSGLLHDDKQLEEYLNRLAAKLLPPVQGRPRIIMKVLRHPSLNAFAYPTGRVYVHTGILAAMDNEAQLAAVMAHEITHVQERHLAREFTSRKKKSAEEADSLRKILTSVNCYSQLLESEADAAAVRMMVAAGYDPREAPGMLEHLKRESEEEKIRVRKADMIHPAIRERIKNTTDMANKEYPGVAGLKNTEIFARYTTPLLLDNAELDLKRGSFLAAERAIEKYLAGKQSDPRAYYLLGERHRQGRPGNEEKARASYRKAIILSQTYPDPYRALGLIDFKKGSRLEAKKNLQHYLDLKPNAEDREHIRQYVKACE